MRTNAASLLWVPLALAVASSASLAACSGASRGSDAVASAKARPKSTFDPCAGDKPPPRTYTGPLKDVRCEQEMFLTMAGIADDLGVKCDHCHVPKPDNPKSFFYEQMTPNKEVASWMSHTFMTGLKRKDGRAMDCGDCHTDRSGKPAAKFLGQPRDEAFAVEWMTSVMTRDFVLADGTKLKCKHCHVGSWGSPTFERKVIGRTEQVPHGTIPDATPPADPTPSEAPAETPPPALSAAPSAEAPP